MVASASLDKEPTLRQSLKERTRALHDRLDQDLAPLAIGRLEDYAAFLSISYAARSAIEATMERHSATALVPPPTAHLIARDLTVLGKPLPPPLLATVPDGDAALGVAWALGGSSLGNRALLARRRQLSRTGPTHFLADRAGAAFFAGLLPLLAGPALPDRAWRAVAGATAVFELFLAAAARVELEDAA